ncbi:Rossmann-like and DUF2520 domain-containing protein [Cloacibacterium normanense]|uniref:DUF2520 domain-containing protein n=1 Tax=Cloacibacterium normanense TaxID=237258 RepID=A0A1E5UCK4_9FLAO|nr:Rossmann-like and DUF2520 domain-containing protein [Cloacibacterium normanense]AZI70431.1 DUF2520 domain-containing protein [Cloacibacterium normanense]OEL10590.1 hypothetical protein BHF72_0413 [Cloacibacterium normanense]SDO28653.1 Predicted oxidoreductase, contains short-chain dehydrogenase (SDR) and DUF2520 domains [Cloacibacterium normanense]
MQIVLIGSGNVAFHLAKAFTEAQIPISQIFGRNTTELQKISEQFSIPFSAKTLAEADLYIISVSDSSIAEVSALIKNENALVAHTSGSVSREALSGNYRKSVFYPLQTFSKSKNLDYSKIPFFIDAENENDEEILKNLASKISKNVMLANDEKRKYIHLTAVFACNFVNHLYARAKEISDSQGIPFDYFLPLIDETTQKIHELEPKLAQTGPAIRNDEKVLKLHESLLTDEEKLKIYKTLNESIKKMYH